MENHEKQFIAGFNSGYLLTEHEPDIITNLLKDVQPVNSYFSGMSFGLIEFELMQSKSHINEIEKLRQKHMDTKKLDKNN